LGSGFFILLKISEKILFVWSGIPVILYRLFFTVLCGFRFWVFFRKLGFFDQILIEEPENIDGFVQLFERKNVIGVR